MHLWIRQSSLVHGRIGSIVGNANFETGVFAAAAKGPPTNPPKPLMPHAPPPVSYNFAPVQDFYSKENV